MRVCACLLLWLWSITSLAVDFGSIAVYTPKPAYPERLGEEDVSGKVKVSYTIQADGKVTRIKILESTHPLFDVEVIRTLKTWRFKPWEVSLDRPPTIEEKATIDFSTVREGKLSIAINDELRYWRCSDVNREVEGSASAFPEQPMSNALFFWATSAHISEALIKAKVSDAEREILMEKLRRALMNIVQRCKQNPDAYYQDYLPDEIKKFVFSTKANAAGFQLIPHYIPAIPYPVELLKERKEGEVLASYVVQANGTVTKVKVLASTHPLFAASAEKTIPTWRFRPWIPSDDKRAEIEVSAPFRFHIGTQKTAPPDSNVILAKTKCSEVNEAFRELDKNWRDYPLVKMRIFWHTEQYLNAPFMTANASAAEIETMTKDFKAGLVGILNNCRKNPDAKYADYLPEQIRQFL
jgi:TonB family protein